MSLGLAREGQLLAGLAFLFAGTVAAMVLLLGILTRSQRSDVRILRRLSIYTLTGGSVPAAVTSQEERAVVLLGDSQFARRAVAVVGDAARRRGIAGALDGRLDAAGLPMRSGEWILLHTAAALLSTLVFVGLSGGSLLAAGVGFVLGATGPWFFVMVRQGRRESAFLAQLPDTLQLLAGSLQAGYALPQALDTIVREGRPPMSVEFNRALVETRLGVAAEDALEGISRRMDSADFAWVVMAIRIQREVGGNLAELLLTVSNTLRERETLRRQVSVLTAEGRLSAWILGALPVVFAVYLVVVRPQYIGLLLTTPIGLGMLGLAVVLLVVGAVWLSRVVRLEV